MDSKAEIFIKRARTEINTGVILLNASNNDILLQFDIPKDETFYSGAISHCYYSIFYSAKAMLLTKGIETESPDVHRKTFDAFKVNFIDTGVLDAELLLIYKKIIIKADTLLEIFRVEKKKRGDFTYNTIAQANLDPAKESLENAKTFYKHINTFLIKIKDKQLEQNQR
ncbi:MAG: HEPN domain-containing protein [archaeon]